eukprot:Colp12_sorted_trinity150504_noHs@36002
MQAPQAYGYPAAQAAPFAQAAATNPFGSGPAVGAGSYGAATNPFADLGASKPQPAAFGDLSPFGSKPQAAADPFSGLGPAKTNPFGGQQQPAQPSNPFF